MRRLLTHPSARLVALGSFFVAAAFSRRPSTLLTPQFWAEDGLIFYQQAHELGFSSTLFTPHAGYLHVLPRLVAGMALSLPLSLAPLLFAVVGLLATCLPAIYLASNRLENVAPLHVRVLLGVLYVGVPNVWRVLGNLTNAQWHVAILCLLILIASAPKSVWAAVFDVTVLAIGSVTGPFSIFLLPAAIMVAWQRRDRWSTIRAVLVAVGVVVIGFSIVTGTRQIARASLGASFSGFCRIIAFQIFAPVFWGSNTVANGSTRPNVRLRTLC